MSMLQDLLLLGDIASNLLCDTVKAVGLNNTQMRICLTLAHQVRNKVSKRPPMTPADISLRCAGRGSKVHAQLAILCKEELGMVVNLGSAINGETDERRRYYQLTDAGLAAATKYFSLLRSKKSVDYQFERFFSEKEIELIHKLRGRVAEALEQGALTSEPALISALMRYELKNLPSKKRQ
jgi:DNA-binding MarR family transcriptional regulator